MGKNWSPFIPIHPHSPFICYVLFLGGEQSNFGFFQQMLKCHHFYMECSSSDYAGNVRKSICFKSDEWFIYDSATISLILWLRPLHTAEKHRPTMFHTVKVRPKRSGPSILYNTPLSTALMSGVDQFEERGNRYRSTPKPWVYVRKKKHSLDLWICQA